MDLKTTRIGIIGGGVVGRATARSYLEHVQEVRVYDVLPERCTHSVAETLACDLVFICLPEQHVDAFLGSVRHNGGKETCHLVIKSTVPIGYTRHASSSHALPNLVHSPEFLTARCATLDAQLPARNIIGVNQGIVNPETLPLFCLYQARWPHVPIHILFSDASEAVKLFQNSFFAVKVAYWNECYQLCQQLGLDWQAVRNAILADGRVHPSHTQVPGPDGKLGFGGACLPKDLAQLIRLLHEHVDGPYVAEAALARNHRDRNRTTGTRTTHDPEVTP